MKAITRGDPLWPARLAELPEPPEQLYLVGDPALLMMESVAVVGSRASTAYGDTMANMITAGLSTKYVIVAGGAFGIDAAAHRSALASNGKTIAVLPCGLDQRYPEANRSLLEQIVGQGGLLVSEYPPGTAPNRTHFLARNRITAALARGTVVVESRRLSGSLATARRAAELNRPVMAVPGPVTSALSEGCHALIREGATLVRTARDVMDVLEKSQL